MGGIPNYFYNKLPYIAYFVCDGNKYIPFSTKANILPVPGEPMSSQHLGPLKEEPMQESGK